MSKILDILFGKDNNIFNSKGKVQHDIGKSRWNKWSDRFTADPNYDFHKHSGQELKKKGEEPKSKV